jgi:hypothetical protein
MTVPARRTRLSQPKQAIASACNFGDRLAGLVIANVQKSALRCESDAIEILNH